MGGAAGSPHADAVVSTCHHAALAASHLLSLDQLFIVCGAAGFLVMLGAVTGQVRGVRGTRVQRGAQHPSWQNQSAAADDDDTCMRLQTSVLEQVAHRASRMRPRDLFLDPSRVLPGGPNGAPGGAGQPAARLPPSVGGGLSGTTPEQLQSYMRLTAGSDAAQPGVVAVRNRALATAASYSVRIAIK